MHIHEGVWLVNRAQTLVDWSHKGQKKSTSSSLRFQLIWWLKAGGSLNSAKELTNAPGCCCCFSRSVVFDSLRPHGLLPTRLLCPWTSPGQSTGVGCHFLLQGIFLTRDWTCVSCTGREILHHWATRKATSMVPRLRKHFLCTLSSKLYFSLSFIMLSIRCQNA